MKTPAFLLALACATLAQAQQNQGSQNHEMASAFEVIHVRPNIYMIASDAGNVTLQVADAPGRDGVLLVDTGPAKLSAALLAEIRKISPKPIRFILNTSADPHHTGGNQALVTSEPPESVGVFAQDNVLTRMSSPAAGAFEKSWPTITFQDLKDFTFNGEPVQMIAEKNAHTDGDSFVFFRVSNVISTGDIFLTTGYPVIDVQRGGSIQGELTALNHLLDLTVPESMQEGGTLVIPGQGRLCDESEVTDYRDMVTIIRDRVANLIKMGKSLQEAKAARLSRDYDGRYSTPSWTGDMFVEAIYAQRGHT
jgi:cyclase